MEVEEMGEQVCWALGWCRPALKIKAKLSRRPKGHVATIKMSHIYNRMLHVYLKNFDKSEKKKT
jgi:hypothetical protein